MNHNMNYNKTLILLVISEVWKWDIFSFDRIQIKRVFFLLLTFCYLAIYHIYYVYLCFFGK